MMLDEPARVTAREPAPAANQPQTSREPAVSRTILNRRVSDSNTDTLRYKASGWFGYKTGDAFHAAARSPAPPT
ncbi:hypothetical protein [Burkholderia sp. Nafp2/4-1b]|uniref:hypothetical protein n=1 Tax=Burkholderia sp. Nafp2/4-1b TaxID=2116686 RepID=UPI0013CEF450|nr:hypothetical protein [Burkholderia sp. Nafp2/4-1b]